MLLDFANLDFKENGNFYNNIYEKIKEGVLAGAIKKGEKLPSIREAAKILGVSRTTIENAYTRLCIEGIAESFPQRGYFITDYKKVDLKNHNSSDNTQEILFDNMKTIVDQVRSDYTDVVINNKALQFSKDAGFKIVTCRPYRPRTKGKVETLAKIMNVPFVTIDITSFSETGYKSVVLIEDYPIEKGTYRVMGTFRCNTETQTAYSPNQTYS